MSAGPILDVPKLNEHEMQQLQVLLFRYLVHKAAGLSDVVTDKLVNKSQLTPALAAPLAEPMETAEPEGADAAPPPDTQKRKAGAKSAEANPPAFTVGMKEKHDIYWKTEANMIEGNPMLILERGDKVVMPPAIWIQGRPDEVHDYHDPDGGFPGNEPERFVSNYRKAGGDIEITYFDNEKRNTDVTHQPVLDFVKKHTS